MNVRGRMCLDPYLNRYAVRIEAFVEGHGLRMQVRITDISSDGCCMGANGLKFRPGQPISLYLESLTGLDGQIRWVRPDKAGMMFDRPLTLEMLRRLVGELDDAVELSRPAAVRSSRPVSIH